MKKLLLVALCSTSLLSLARAEGSGGMEGGAAMKTEGAMKPGGAQAPRAGRKETKKQAVDPKAKHGGMDHAKRDGMDHAKRDGMDSAKHGAMEHGAGMGHADGQMGDGAK
ncbi:hypothetical protein [Anaeromyxobacter sp. PSR-1]|uniref:hypothetical protein n=1 Tax=unclassified Anaeromyxobacter TaxID=2620896 RepID=UPI0005E37362|nr:hypothetical protein [Anaeromyxobacter sp. PSR-1]GAO01739.1 hypothetical protein PSR1_00599 [Anaeromyxobacter sp. PSR-1]